MPHERWFYPFGFTLQLETNSPAIIAAAETSFGKFGAPPQSANADWHFRFFAHKIDDGQLNPPIFRREGSLVYQTTGRDSTLVVDTARGLAFGYFSPTILANPAYFRWHFLELACFLMLPPRGWLGVHAAAIVRNGRAILLRAASGGGKTTLAYSATRHGQFQALAEEVTWLNITTATWRGLPWSFHLLPDAKNLFPELQPYQPILQTNGELKLEVTLPDSKTATIAEAGPVVLVQRTPAQRSRLERLDLATAKPLWLAGAAGNEMEFPEYDRYIDNLLSQAYQLYFGDDIDRAVDLLVELTQWSPNLQI